MTVNGRVAEGIRVRSSADAYGLDSGEAASALVLCALGAACGEAVPSSASGPRGLWLTAGGRTERRAGQPMVTLCCLQCACIDLPRSALTSEVRLTAAKDR
ncbi:MAG TPA: hypothetical protein VIJ15_15880, partial [Dermatophilaceae bacterium]